MNHISKPKFAVLTVFAIVSFANLTAYIWWFSFDWLFGATPFIVGLLILIFIGLGLSSLIDWKFDSRLKRYFIVALVELLFICSIANPIRRWQINESLTRAKDITEPLRKFKTQFGYYPTSLIDLQQKLKLDLPNWTYLGTVYQYEQDGNNNYVLTFHSYGGYTASYDKDGDNWIFVD